MGFSRNTGVDCHSLLQRIFPTQGSSPGLLHCRQILYHLIDYLRHIHHLFNNLPHHKNYCVYRPLLRHSEIIFKQFLPLALEIRACCTLTLVLRLLIYLWQARSCLLYKPLNLITVVNLEIWKFLLIVFIIINIFWGFYFPS